MAGVRPCACPKEFRLSGKEVRVRRLGNGVLLEPLPEENADLSAIFAALAQYRHVPLMEDGRQQRDMPPSENVSFDT